MSSEIFEVQATAQSKDSGDQNSQGPIGEDPGPPYDPPPTDGTNG